MHKNPTATVITAVRNGARYLPDTIACICAQSVTDWEYLIVDDASEDDTRDVVREWTARDNRIRLLERSEPGGPYVAANQALEEARGEYVFRIDGDDLSPPHRFEMQIDFLKRQPSLKACITYWRALRGTQLRKNAVTMPTRPNVLRWYFMLRGASVHSSACVMRTAFDAVGGYRPELLSQDYRLWCDLSRKNWLGVVPEVLSWVRMHPRRSSHSHGGIQLELAMSVLADHVSALDGNHWSETELRALRAVGHSEVQAIGEGLRVLDRWEELWRADPSLDRSDIAELAAFSFERRWKHIRSNLRRQPGAAARAGLGLSPRLLDGVRLASGWS